MTYKKYAGNMIFHLATYQYPKTVILIKLKGIRFTKK